MSDPAPSAPLPAPAADPRRLDLLLALLVLLAAAAVFAPALPGAFYWDEENVFANGGVARLGPDLWAHFVAPRFGLERYRPLYTWSLALNHAVGGMEPYGYHLVNTLCHALTALLFFPVAARLLGSRTAGFLAALLFAVHAVHVESVAYTAQRSGPLAGPFVLAAFWLWLRNSRPAYLGALAAYLLALFAYEGAAPLPAMLWLCERLPHRRPRGAWWAGLGRAAGFLLPLALYLALRRHAMAGAAEEFGDFTAGVPRLVVLLTLARFFLTEYVTGFLVGFLPLPAYAQNQFAWAAPDAPGAWLAAAWLAGMIGWSLYAWARRGSAPACGWLGAGLFLLPVSGLLVPMYGPGAQRFCYLPSLGVCLAFGAVLGGAPAPGAADPLRRRRRAGALAGLVLLAHAAATGYGAWVVGEPLRAARHFLWLAPDHPLYLSIQASAFARAGRRAEAPASYDRARRVDPFAGEALANRAALALAEADLIAAEALSRRMAEYPGIRGALGWCGQAEVALRREQPAAAERLSREAMARAPGAPQGLRMLGRALAAQGRLEDALAPLTRATEVDPLSGDGWFVLGQVARARQDYVAAAAALERALALAPAAAVAVELGLVFDAQGRIPEALGLGHEAAGAGPEARPALFHLGRVLVGGGRPAEAEEALRELLRQTPEDGAARLLLGRALAAQARDLEAEAELERALADLGNRPEEEAGRAEARAVLEQVRARRAAGS
ncbi:MAG: tetratricopeptide repeat protein [Planctomycetes bacterium]|nr:tetratricopeptide repeat protein [Planctomycetota bacterium]